MSSASHSQCTLFTWVCYRGSADVSPDERSGVETESRGTAVHQRVDSTDREDRMTQWKKAWQKDTAKGRQILQRGAIEPRQLLILWRLQSPRDRNPSQCFSISPELCGDAWGISSWWSVCLHFTSYLRVI